MVGWSASGRPRAREVRRRRAARRRASRCQRSRTGRTSPSAIAAAPGASSPRDSPATTRPAPPTSSATSKAPGPSRVGSPNTSSSSSSSSSRTGRRSDELHRCAGSPRHDEDRGRDLSRLHHPDGSLSWTGRHHRAVGAVLHAAPACTPRPPARRARLHAVAGTRNDSGPMTLRSQALVPRVELRGLEPLTPTLPVWCATSCATAPRAVSTLQARRAAPRSPGRRGPPARPRGAPAASPPGARPGPTSRCCPGPRSATSAPGRRPAART